MTRDPPSAWFRLGRRRHRFAVRIHGRFVELAVERGGIRPAGFLATRVLDADSVEEARETALATVRADLAARSVTPFGGKPLEIHVESARRVPWWRHRLWPLRGFTFYASEDADPD